MCTLYIWPVKIDNDGSNDDDTILISLLWFSSCHRIITAFFDCWASNCSLCENGMFTVAIFKIYDSYNLNILQFQLQHSLLYHPFIFLLLRTDDILYFGWVPFFSWNVIFEQMWKNPVTASVSRVAESQVIKFLAAIMAEWHQRECDGNMQIISSLLRSFNVESSNGLPLYQMETL